MINGRAEAGIIKLMLSNHADDVLDMVDEKLMLSREALTAFRKIGGLSFSKSVNFRVLKKEYEDDEHMSMYIHSCEVQHDVTIHDLPDLIDNLLESYTRTKSVEYAQTIMTKSNGDISELKKLVGTGLDFGIADTTKLYEDPRESAGKWFNKILEDYKNPDGRGRIPIKVLPQLHKTLGGLDRENGDLILMCAQSGKGKTAFALTLAKDFCLDQGLSVLYMNCEMNTDQLQDRIAAMSKGIDLSEIDSRIFTGSQEAQMDKIHRLSEVADAIGKSKLFFSQTPSITPRLIRRAFKKLELSGNRPDIVFIDYIAYMDLEKPTSGMQEHQLLLEYAITCKQLAVEFKTPFIALAQLNADGKLEGAKKMINPCDGVFFISEIKRTADDEMEPRQKQKAEAEIKRELNAMSGEQQRKANYKIVKEKVRRGDSSMPIYLRFDKSQMKVREIE